MAISNSKAGASLAPAPPRRPVAAWGAIRWTFLLLAALAGAGGPLRAEPPLPKDFQHHLERFRAAFDTAQARWKQGSNSVQAAWEFGRAAFDWAEFATNDLQRSTVAELGIEACRRAIALDSNQVAAHYYLGLNLGQLARTKLLGALRLIDEMEVEWSTAIRLDPKFDYGGPHRAIGVLYRDAPGWPTSVGSEKKSRLHLEKAFELHPEYPGNRLTLYEGLVEWGDKRRVREKADETETFLRTARMAFSGDRWAWDWDDWDRRWAAVRRKAGVKPAPPASP